MERIAVDLAIPIGMMALIVVTADFVLSSAARTESRLVKFGLILVIPVLFALSFPAADSAIQNVSSDDSINRVWIDPSPFALGIPIIVGLPLLALLRSRFLRNDHASRGLLIAWCTLVLLLSTVNWCAPGWCAHYGFPFSFYGWSDAMISFNGWEPSPFNAVTFVLDLAVWVAGGYGIVKRSIRRLAPARAT
jgi:hypothetical protein